MKVRIALLLMVFCLALPAYAPEAQDSTAGHPQETPPATIEGREMALAEHLQAASELRQANDLLNAAHHLNRAGYLQLMLNRPGEALVTFQDSLALTQQVTDPKPKVDALNGAATFYLRSATYAQAKPLLDQAIEISTQSNYVPGHGEALLLLANYKNRTDHLEALKTAQEALAQWQTTTNTRGIIRSHLAVGNYHLALNSLSDATQSNETALSLARTKGFKDLEADAFIYLGFVEYRKGSWHKVTELVGEAVPLFDPEAEPKKMTQVSSSIAEAYIESGLPEIGLVKYKDALEYIRKTKDPRNEEIIKLSVGRAEYLSGKYEEALHTLGQTLKQGESLNDMVVMAMSHETLGETHEAMNHHLTALQHLEKALNLYTSLKNTMEAARTRALIGRVYENDGQIAKARSFYTEALEIFDRLSERVNQSATLFALGGLEMKNGNYEIAEKHLQRSIVITEDMRRTSTSRDLTAAFSATVHDRYAQYIQCLMRKHRDPAEMSRVIRAFETSESARARSLAELLRVTDTDLLSSAHPGLSEQERLLRHLIYIKENDRVELLRKPYKKEELQKLAAELERLGAEYKNLLATINQRYPAYEQITQPQSWSLRRIQEEVIGDDDTLLLEYLLGAEKSYVWAVTRSSITSHELPSQGAITDATTRVYELLKKPPKTDTAKALDQATKNLADMILLPVADQLHKQRLIVAADGALNYIPFQILPATPNAEWLVAQHTIVYAPSASVLGELGKESGRRGGRQKVLAALGDPRFAEQKQNEQIASARSIELPADSMDPTRWGELFYAAREIENLREVASDEQTFAATEYDATRDQLLKLDLTQYSILHFATHGLLDPKRPERSGLLLSTTNREGQTLEGFVGLQDVYSLRAPVDLVVLSACQTGLGKDIRGEGLIGLTRGFMYAGASSVVASLWKVEDESTAELMKRFYTEMLQNGKTPAEALRLAQNSIRQIPRWSAPHYWAGFTLQGEYRYPVYSPPRTGGGWGLYPVVLLSAGVILLLTIGVILIKVTKRRKPYSTTLKK